MAMVAVVAGPQLRMRAHVAVGGDKLICGSSSSSRSISVAWRVTGRFGLHISSSSCRAPLWVRAAALSEDAAVEEPSVAELPLVEEQPAAAAPAYEGPTVKVTFELQRECHFGQQFKVVGGDALFGDWDPTNAVTLNWTEGHVWTAEVDVPEGKKFEFKYVLTGQEGEVEWQPRTNLELDAAAGSGSLVISEPWEVAPPAEPEATTGWEATSSPEEDNTTTPADAVADAAASAAVGALDAGVKVATAISDTINGVGEDETPTAVEIPVVDAALASAAAPAPAPAAVAAKPAAAAAAKPAASAAAAEEVSGESKKKKKTTSK